MRTGWTRGSCTLDESTAVSAPASCRDSSLLCQQRPEGMGQNNVRSSNVVLEFDLRVLGTTYSSGFGSLGLGSPQLLQLTCANSSLAFIEQSTAQCRPASASGVCQPSNERTPSMTYCNCSRGSPG